MLSFLPFPPSLLVPLLVALIAHRLRLLTSSGAVAAVCVGGAVVLRGWAVTGMLLTFFAAGSAATKVKQKQKERDMPYPETEAEASRRAAAAADAAAGKRGAVAPAVTAVSSSPQSPTPRSHDRDHWQVLATGLVPAMICVLHSLFPDAPPTSPEAAATCAAAASACSPSLSFLCGCPSVRAPWFLAYLSFVATCCGDTLASELGMLSNQRPLLLFRGCVRVPRGVDGGVSFVGTLASIVGGAIIGAWAGEPFDVYAAALYGCVGALIDSMLGTWMQSKQYAAADRRVGARDAEGFRDAALVAHASPLPLTPRAWKHLNNLVNVLSSLLAAALAVAVQYLYLTRGIDLLPHLSLVCALILLTLTPTVGPSRALGGSAAIGLAWATVFSGLPQAQPLAGLPIVLVYMILRMRV